MKLNKQKDIMQEIVNKSLLWPMGLLATDLYMIFYAIRVLHGVMSVLD